MEIDFVPVGDSVTCKIKVLQRRRIPVIDVRLDFHFFSDLGFDN